jgi:hypothetical protein
LKGLPSLIDSTPPGLKEDGYPVAADFSDAGGSIHLSLYSSSLPKYSDWQDAAWRLLLAGDTPQYSLRKTSTLQHTVQSGASSFPDSA